MVDVLERFAADARAQRGWVAKVSAATDIPVKTLRGYVYAPGKDPAASRVAKLREFYETLDTTALRASERARRDRERKRQSKAKPARGNKAKPAVRRRSVTKH